MGKDAGSTWVSVYEGSFGRGPRSLSHSGSSAKSGPERVRTKPDPAFAVSISAVKKITGTPDTYDSVRILTKKIEV